MAAKPIYAEKLGELGCGKEPVDVTALQKQLTEMQQTLAEQTQQLKQLQQAIHAGSDNSGDKTETITLYSLGSVPLFNAFPPTTQPTGEQP